MFDFICEELVQRYQGADQEIFLDTACHALTRLPARCIRHGIDMAFYLAPGECGSMLQNVSQAVDEAAEFIFERCEANAG